MVDGLRAECRDRRPATSSSSPRSSPTSFASRRAGAYSLGTRQRLTLAAALLGDPQVIVLDEPTTGLDVRGVAWLRRQLREWVDVGRTVLVASHSLKELAAMVDWLLVLDRGRLVREVARDELDHGVDLQTAVFELLTARQPSRARRLLTGRVPFAALRL